MFQASVLVNLKLKKIGLNGMTGPDVLGMLVERLKRGRVNSGRVFYKTGLPHIVC